MAVIGEAPRAINDPNYINQSRGVASRTADTSLGTLFANLGGVVDQTATLLDNNNKENIKEDIQSRVDAERDVFGVAQATEAASQGVSLIPNQNTPQVPATVSKATSEVGRLQAAYQSGKLSDSYYWARINAITKQVRTANPGYRDYVDETVSKIVGGDPANRLRNSIQSELAAQQALSQGAANRWETFVRQNMEYIGQIAPDYFSNPNKYSQNQIETGVMRLQTQKAQIQQSNLEMENRLKFNQLSSEEAQSEANTRASQAFGNVVTSVSTQINDEINRMIKDGRVPTAEEANNVRSRIQSLRSTLELQMRQMLTTPFTEGGSSSFTTVIKDSKKLQEIIDNNLAPLKMIEEAATNGNYNLVKLATQTAEMMTSGDKLKILQSQSTLRSINAVRGIVGDQGVSQLLTNSTTLGNFNSELKATLDQNFWGRASGDTSRSFSQKINDLRTAGSSTPNAAAVKQEFNNITVGLTSQSPEVRINTAKDVFSPDGISVLNRFNGSERSNILKMFTTTPVVKSMQELKSTSPETWQAYRNWARDATISVVKGAADNLQDSALNDQLVNIRYNPQTNNFEVVPSDAYVQAQRSPSRNFQYSPEAYQARSTLLQSSVNQVNEAINSLKPLIEADGGKVDQETIQTIMGVDVNTPKQAGFMNMIIDSLDGVYGNEPEENVRRPSGDGRQSSIPDMLSFVSTAQAAVDPTERALRPGRLADGGTNLQFGNADVENLSSSARSMLQGIADSGALPYIRLNSGYRDPSRNARAGGARRSQHMHGNAVDIDVSGFTDEQKAQLLEQAIANGAKGIGIYPSGRSIHIDTRGTPTVWGSTPGASYKGHSVEEAPAWAQGALRKLFDNS